MIDGVLNVYKILLRAFESNLSKKELRKIIENPLWKETNQIRDWRNYIPESVQENWRYLSWDAKATAFLMAEEQAGNENWEWACATWKRKECK